MGHEERFIILCMPRSGSTALTEILQLNPKISLGVESSEFLNSTVFDIPKSESEILEYLEKKLSNYPEKKGKAVLASGFKVFPQQLEDCNLRFDTMVRSLGIQHIFVLWREDTASCIISELIAYKTNEWYKDTETPTQQSHHLEPAKMEETIKRYETCWTSVLEQWPLGLEPFFLTYESLFKDYKTMNKAMLERMGLEPCGWEEPFSRKQNPGSLDEKVSNWQDFPEWMRNFRLNVPNLFCQTLKTAFGLPGDMFHLLPELEPTPPEKWYIRVGAPFLPEQSKQNVRDALDAGAVSSAAVWVKKMSDKLKEIFDVPVAVPTCNGFSALVLALQAAKVGPGDDVIIPSFTMIAVANAVHFIRANPIFADNCKENRYNPCWEDIAKVATSKVKAVIVCHTYGVPCSDIEDIYLRCQNNNWKLIEDISEVAGISYKTKQNKMKLLGSFGDFAAASLYANKILNAGDGGFVLAKDAKLDVRLWSLVNHGFTKSFHFVHFEPAINAKINGLGAALACGNLDHIEDAIESRREKAKIYREQLSAQKSLILMPNAGAEDAPWVFGVECPTKLTKTRLRKHLARYGIETRDYFFPIHLQPAFNGNLPERQRPDQIRLPVVEDICSRGLYLPIHGDMTREDVEFVSEKILEFFQSGSHNFSNKNRLAEKNYLTKVVRIVPSSEGITTIQARTFDTNTGCLTNVEATPNNPAIRALNFTLKFVQFFTTSESWGDREILKEEAHALLQKTNPGSQEFISIKKLYDYLVIEQNERILNGKFPWLNYEMKPEMFSASSKIPTLCTEKFLQFLGWIITEVKPKTVLEVGAWLGNSAVLMAEAGKETIQKIYSADLFEWFPWMLTCHTGLEKCNLLEEFSKNTQEFKDIIFPLVWNVEEEKIPTDLDGKYLDFVFLDFSKKASELEMGWQKLKPLLKANHTIVLFHGIDIESVQFFVDHHQELDLLFNPPIRAKAFRYMGMDHKKSDEIESNPEHTMTRKIKFEEDPGWSHHHLNAFSLAINKLKEEFHSDDASTIFLPAVEQGFCDGEIPQNPWIGIIHMLPNSDEDAYVPDLHQLCGKKYKPWFRLCKGLFTLTHVQEDYLKENLKVDHVIPIQTIFYPMVIPKMISESHSLENWKGGNIDLVLIGSYERDFKYFYRVKVPTLFEKAILVGDDVLEKEVAENTPKHIKAIPKANAEEYEKLLQTSLVFLSLNKDGLANTLVLEALARNIPIVAPNFRSITQYLGSNYPLLYDPKKDDLTEILQKDRIQSSIGYLKSMDKSHLSHDAFVESVRSSCVFKSLPPAYSPDFDVTVCICSFRRTHHLQRILDQIWKKQTYSGRIQIIIWNNNTERRKVVDQICHHFIKTSNECKSLELIHSSENYFCIVRKSIAQLMKSTRLLICDDDIIPNEDFIKFFLDGNRSHPRDVLCVRGHYFLPHTLPEFNPERTWEEYEFLRFADDEKDERLIHFVHADACLFPLDTLMEISSEKMPDRDFDLVDDYWFSFLLGHKFGRRLRKLSTKGLNVLTRTDDSDLPGLALHTRPEVQDARYRLYIHHMLQGWPKFAKETFPQSPIDPAIVNAKTSAWNDRFVGFNINSDISDEALDVLQNNLEVTWVRVGAVGAGRKEAFEFQYLVEEDNDDEFKNLLGRLTSRNLKVVITLDRRIAIASTWEKIASMCTLNPNVVGYDIINEPFTTRDSEGHWSDVAFDGCDEILDNYQNIISAIHRIDPATPIILEPTFWGQAYGLDSFDISKFREKFPDINLMVSVHFYEPQTLTFMKKNKRRYKFPGQVPVYKDCIYDFENWDDKKVAERFSYISNWAKNNEVKIFIGEIGISRNVEGAELYLKSCLDASASQNLSLLLYAFRDPDWKSMDYEFGTDGCNHRKRFLKNNILMETIHNAIKATK